MTNSELVPMTAAHIAAMSTERLEAQIADFKSMPAAHQASQLLRDVYGPYQEELDRRAQA